MKKVVYDFSEAIAELEGGFTARELSENLQATALRCAWDVDREKNILKMQAAVMDACRFLDAIEEKEIEQ